MMTLLMILNLLYILYIFTVILNTKLQPCRKAQKNIVVEDDMYMWFNESVISTCLKSIGKIMSTDSTHKSTELSR